MHAGKLVFAQVMEFAPRHTFVVSSASTAETLTSDTAPSLASISFCAWPSRN
jgi:hypothetical protein